MEEKRAQRERESLMSRYRHVYSADDLAYCAAGLAKFRYPGDELYSAIGDVVMLRI